MTNHEVQWRFHMNSNGHNCTCHTIQLHSNLYLSHLLSSLARLLLGFCCSFLSLNKFDEISNYGSSFACDYAFRVELNSLHLSRNTTKKIVGHTLEKTASRQRSFLQLSLMSLFTPEKTKIL